MATLNLFDVPEMMPGARLGATPAERQGFELRCRQLATEEYEEQKEHRASQPIAAATVATSATDFVAMFPAIDADLVHAICAESTPEQAMETLLALNVAMDATVEPARPSKEVAIEDMGQFPSLTDKDGWQVLSKRGFELDKETDLGNAWCERAKDASELANAGWGPRKQALVPNARKSSGRDSGVAVANSGRQHARNMSSCGVEAGEYEAGEYELRHSRGQRRAKRFSNQVCGPPSEQAAAVAVGELEAQASGLEF